MGTSHLDVRALNYICYEIKKSPHKLQNHVRRIHLSQKFKANLIFSALVDLFIVLGSNGIPLKKRLLRKYQAEVSATELSFLLNHVDSLITGDMEWIPEACLFKTYDNPIAVFARGEERMEESGSEQEPGEIQTLVDTYIENCQLGVALETLEDYLIDHSSHSALSETLLELYEAVKDWDRCAGFIERLKKQDVSLSKQWMDAEHQLVNKQ
ncbi:MAG: hypothetical protein MI976_24925, partial [Pseudomonadales bacterium]|nr:hypothetical protein [Pseudomonadales bacterium]